MAILDDILLARDKRHKLREGYSNNGIATVSLSLNIPGYPKSDDLIHVFFLQILSELKTYLKAHRILLKGENDFCIIDSDGDFYLSGLENALEQAEEIKNISEEFEETHALGRLIDVDVVSAQGKVISSGKTKSCFYCGNHAAISCMREKRHSVTVLRAYAFDAISAYLENTKKAATCKKLAGFATRAILYEIALTPKPGLIDTVDSGVHNDMDYFTFLNSTSVISQYFLELAQRGYSFKGNYKNILPFVRNIGLQAEASMFEATNGVNTQKGIVFFMGLSLFVSAHVIAKFGNFNELKFRNIITEACARLDSELVDNKKATTHGEICNAEFGYKIGGGARAEAQSGFSTVFNSGLPELRKYNPLFNSNKNEIEIALRNTLLAILSVCNDSTILYRSNSETLEEFKALAKKTLKNSGQNTLYHELIDYCQQKNISPGGSADLLAITVFIRFIEHTNFYSNDC